MNDIEELRQARKVQVEIEAQRLKSAKTTTEKHNARRDLIRAQRFLAAVTDER